MNIRDHRVNVDSGKYTFVIPASGGPVQILRDGAPWIEQPGAQNAIHALICELDAARFVILTARACVQMGTAPVELTAALNTHEGLVSDHEPPSEWTWSGRAT